MVKCLIRIKTKVSVHLRMINHCYRDVRVRVLTLGPRLLGKALGALPLFPTLPNSNASSEAPSGLGVQHSSTAGLESLRDSGHSTPVRSVSSGSSFLQSHGSGAEGGYGTAEFSEDSYSPSDSMLSTPVSNDHSSDQAQVRHTNGPHNIQEDRGTELSASDQARPLGQKAKGSCPGKTRSTQRSPEEERVNEFICSLARLFLVTVVLLFALLLLLIVLTESELDLAFLRDIRRTPEFQQFHYEYFCPLRRWLACKLRWMGGHLIDK